MRHDVYPSWHFDNQRLWAHMFYEARCVQRMVRLYRTRILRVRYAPDKVARSTIFGRRMHAMMEILHLALDEMISTDPWIVG